MTHVGTQVSFGNINIHDASCIITFAVLRPGPLSLSDKWNHAR